MNSRSTRSRSTCRTTSSAEPKASSPRPVIANRDLYEFAPVAYLTLDRNHVVREANLTAATMFGYARGHLIGVDATALVVPRERVAFHLNLERAFSSTVKETCEVAFSRADRSVFFGRAEIVSVAAADPARGGLWVTIGDLTERKHAEEDFQRAKQAAEAANVARAASWPI